MAEGRRGGKKNRKIGRNRRKPGSARQAQRTFENKTKHWEWECAKAGRLVSGKPTFDPSLSKGRRSEF